MLLVRAILRIGVVAAVVIGTALSDASGGRQIRSEPELAAGPPANHLRSTTAATAAAPAQDAANGRRRSVSAVVWLQRQEEEDSTIGKFVAEDADFIHRLLSQHDCSQVIRLSPTEASTAEAKPLEENEANARRLSAKSPKMPKMSKAPKAGKGQKSSKCSASFCTATTGGVSNPPGGLLSPAPTLKCFYQPRNYPSGCTANDFGKTGCCGGDCATNFSLTTWPLVRYIGTCFFKITTARRKLAKLSSAMFPKNHEKDVADDKTIPMSTDIKALAFLRVPKTGSTTIQKFLKFPKQVYSWTTHLSQPTEELSGLPCISAYAATTAHLGSNYKDTCNTWWNQCPHVPYAGLVKHFEASLDHWSLPQEAVFEDNAKPGSFEIMLESFSIVRDPFDRLVSYFYYLTKFDMFSEFLKDTVTEEQYDRVKARDLYGFMELLHLQGDEFGRTLPTHQYQFFHRDVDAAIALIEGEDGGAPKIFTVVHECFEPSLRVIAETFQGFEPGVVDDFIDSEHYHSNTNKASYAKVGKESLASLREKAEEWFADDFKFYDAAVAKYKEHLKASNIDRSLLEGCKYWPDDEE